MPHVIVKIAAGRTDEQKTLLATQIAKTMVASGGCEEGQVSVSILDIRPEDWVEAVYKQDILGSWSHLYKKPGYDPLK